jgi:hypothetical protein
MLVTVLPSVLKVAILQPCIQPPPGRYAVTHASRQGWRPSPRPGGLRGRSQPGSIQRERKRDQRALGREIICVVGVVGVAAPGRPAAVAVALAVVAGALNAEDPLRSPSR